MISNLRAVRVLSVLLMLILLGACSQLRSFIRAPEPIKQPEPVEQASEPAITQNESAPSVEALAEITPEQRLVQQLRARPNMFALSKRALAPDVKDKMIQALSLFQAGDLAQSNSLVNAVINNELNLTSAVYVLAGDIALAQMTESDDKETLQAQAIIHYQKALSLNPDNAKAANRLAKLMREQGDFVQAEQLYSQAIEAQPMYAASYRNRAVLLDLYLNQKAQALDDYQRYAALLQHRQEQSEQKALVLDEAEQKALSKDLKMVKRWLIDVARQVSALAKAQAKQIDKNTNKDGGE